MAAKGYTHVAALDQQLVIAGEGGAGVAKPQQLAAMRTLQLDHVGRVDGLPRGLPVGHLVGHRSCCLQIADHFRSAADNLTHSIELLLANG